MSTSTPSPASPECLAVVVIVLYRTAPAQSAAFTTFSDLVSRSAPARSTLLCLLYDNGPAPQPVLGEHFPIVYHHDPSNPGLAAAYDFARRVAEQAGAPWLLLLDQDTHLTAAYLNGAMEQAARLRSVSEIVAIAPKLVQGDLLLSPHWPPRHPAASALRYRSGPIQPPLHVFNSGAWLRVSALTAIGGFPRRFPLDYLDHAVFTQLQRNGGRVYLLQAELQHDLAALHMDLYRDFGRLPRLESIIRAEGRFYHAYGTLRDRCVYALRRTRLLTRMLRAGNVKGAYLLLRCTFHPG